MTCTYLTSKSVYFTKVEYRIPSNVHIDNILKNKDTSHLTIYDEPKTDIDKEYLKKLIDAENIISYLVLYTNTHESEYRTCSVEYTIYYGNDTILIKFNKKAYMFEIKKINDMRFTKIKIINSNVKNNKAINYIVNNLPPNIDTIYLNDIYNIYNINNDFSIINNVPINIKYFHIYTDLKYKIFKKPKIPFQCKLNIISQFDNNFIMYENVTDDTNLYSFL